jgi:hypothetical protein
MLSNPWRATSTALVLMVLGQVYFMIAAFQPASFSLVHAKVGEIFDFWTYQPNRDWDNTALSIGQCK